MNKPLPYPPPWQDTATLCAHLCISEGTLDNWIGRKILPTARLVGGKRMWEWSEVESQLRGDGGMVRSEAEVLRGIHNVTKEAANG